VNSNLTFELKVDCEGWPSLIVLQSLAHEAVFSAVRAAKLEIPKQAELSMLFCDDDAMAILNGQYRAINKSTNVLSFPAGDISAGECAAPLLGDVVFSLQTIKNEALVEGRTFEHHLSHLMIHGFLHLFGYDHLEDDDARIMQTLEKDALAHLGISDPYADLEPERL